MRIFAIVIALATTAQAAVTQTAPECIQCYLQNTPAGVVQVCVPCASK